MPRSARERRRARGVAMEGAPFVARMTRTIFCISIFPAFRYSRLCARRGQELKFFEFFQSNWGKGKRDRRDIFVLFVIWSFPE